jgi:hypothetical protein
MSRLLSLGVLLAVAPGCRLMRAWVPPELGAQARTARVEGLYAAGAGERHRVPFGEAVVDVHTPLDGYPANPVPPARFLLTARAPGQAPLHADCELGRARTAALGDGQQRLADAPFMDCALREQAPVPAGEGRGAARADAAGGAGGAAEGRLWVRVAPDGLRHGLLTLGGGGDGLQLRLRSTQRWRELEPAHGALPRPSPQLGEGAFEVYAGARPVAAATSDLLGAHAWLAPGLAAERRPAALAAVALAVMVQREAVRVEVVTGPNSAHLVGTLPLVAQVPPVEARPDALLAGPPGPARAEDAGGREPEPEPGPEVLLQRSRLRRELASATVAASLEEARALLERQPRWTDVPPLAPCDGCVEELRCTGDGCEVFLRYGWRQAAFGMQRTRAGRVRVEPRAAADLEVERFAGQVWGGLDPEGYARARVRAARAGAGAGLWAPSLRVTSTALSLSTPPGGATGVRTTTGFSLGVGAQRWHTSRLLVGYGLDYLQDGVVVRARPVRVHALAPTVRVGLSSWSDFSEGALGIPAVGVFALASPLVGLAHMDGAPPPLTSPFLGWQLGGRVGLGGSWAAGGLVPLVAELSYRFIPTPDAPLDRHLSLSVGLGF